jgi:drug/metabolite transporter (DMT)-like permease
MQSGIAYALLAAALFGASMPFSKTLAADLPPVMLAALLYFGSGLGLGVWYATRAMMSRGKTSSISPLQKVDLPWLGCAILAGGIAGPVLLMTGLALTPASSASLLLNTEAVLTALLAWFVFKENFDRRIFAGMACVVFAGALLSWNERPEIGVPWGPLAIIGACLCWAIDNNLTRKVAARDPVQIACIKGVVAGSVNFAVAFGMKLSLPDAATMLAAGVVGFGGYGLSLVLFVLALRYLGTARTGAYFSAAPFVGAALSVVMLGERPNAAVWLAAALMAIGIWLHLTESHDHKHQHAPMGHDHVHRRDEHHQHAHAAGWDGAEPHAHYHQHAPLVHAHPHYPDIHHRHGH